MEVWILLAAAGSGYLARRWQNAQKLKGSSADEAEDDNNAGPSSCMPTYRGRYRHFSSSGTRQVGKSFCGKGSPYWVRQLPKNVGNATEHKTWGRLNGGEGGKKICREGHTFDDDRKVCETCLGSGAVKAFQTSSRGCPLDLGASKGIESENLSAEPDLSDYLPTMRLSNSCESRTQNMFQDSNVSSGLDRDLQEEVVEGIFSADNPCPLSFKSFSGKRASDSGDDKAFKSGHMLQDGYAGKRMKDAVDSTASQEEGFVFGTWMPGFWDVSEGVFVLDTDSLLVQQESRSKGSSSSRKIRTPNRYGRSRGSRRRNLAARKPMSSLESCLSAQLDEDYNRRTIQNRRVVEPSANAVVRSLGMQSSSNVDSFTSEGNMSVLRADSAIGLPSLSRQPRSKKFSSNSRIPKRPTGRASNGDVVYKPFAGKKYSTASKPAQSSAGWESFGRRGKEECLDAPNEESRYSEGSASSSLEGLLFNFGVGVGMMFTVMSNMREVRRLTLLLKEAELLIKDLEDELERGDELRPDCDSSKNNSAALEQRQTVVNNTLKKVKSATQSLSSMRVLLTNELEAASTMEHIPSKDISKLEAELEAELERMELSLGDGDMLNLQRKSSGSSELDEEVGNLVQGELTIIGLPHEIEVDSEDEDDSDSSHENLHIGNFAVSPRELAKCLHEVLEARQEDRISELEAELKLIGSKLYAKEEELQWLKERSLGPLPGDGEGLLGFDENSQLSSQNSTQLKQTSETEGFSNIELEEHFLRSQIPRSPNASSVSPNFSPYGTNITPLKSSTLFKRGVENKSSTAFITLGGEALAAYKEACDEFSKVSSDPVRTYLAMDRNTERHPFHGGDSVKEATATECNVDLLHMGNSDGWEQVDLLSLAEDFYVGGDPEFMEIIPTLSSIPSKGRHCPRRKNSRNKGSVSSHPEPEQPYSSSRGVDSSDDATNDTSGSTPCSVKFMDVRTAGFCHSEDELGNKVESEANSINHAPYSDWSQEILIRAGVNTPNQEEFHSIYPETVDSPGKFLPALKQGDWGVPDESDYSSELDEQLGQLLIKRIVEKSRKGSPIIQDAQTVLASLDRNDTLQATD